MEENSQIATDNHNNNETTILKKSSLNIVEADNKISCNNFNFDATSTAAYLGFVGGNLPQKSNKK